MKLYQHHKNGKFYTSLGKAVDQENGLEFVLYQNDMGRLFIRPYGMFYEEVVYQGTLVPRFQYIKDVAGMVDVQGRTATHSETDEFYAILSFEHDRFEIKKGEV